MILLQHQAASKQQQQQPAAARHEDRLQNSASSKQRMGHEQAPGQCHHKQPTTTTTIVPQKSIKCPHHQIRRSDHEASRRDLHKQANNTSTLNSSSSRQLMSTTNHLRSTRPFASQAAKLVLATCLLATLCSHTQPAAGLLLFGADSESTHEASSNQQQASPSSPSAPSSASSALLSTIIDSAAKAAISSMSAPSSSSSSSSSNGVGKASASNSPASPPSSDAAAAAPKSLVSQASATTGHSNNSPSSIVASLSSAVASAAVASAVAAARNSLGPASSTSGRTYSKLHSSSLLSTQGRSTQGAPSKQQLSKANTKDQSSLNHIAMRLADAMPEVPYNILHNMKKLDHAAPFYNVDSTPVSKASGSQAALAAAAGGGIRKESSALSSAVSSLLSSAISAASGAASNGGSSLDQLGAVIRTPLWRRLAEGYGDFAAEFRSFFKPASGAGGDLQTASSMHSPTKAAGPLANLGSMSQIMKGSLPIIMLLASQAMKSDWRPLRTNRKSFMQNILGTQAAGSSVAPSSSDTASSLSPLLGSSSALSPVSSSSFLGSLANAADPMQMSGSTGIADSSPASASFGSQIFNALQQQQQQQQQQASFFPTFLQPNQLVQDALSQRSNVATSMKRMGDLEPAANHHNLNVNGLNSSPAANELLPFNLNNEHKPVADAQQSALGPLTLLNANKHELIDDASAGHAQARSFHYEPASTSNSHSPANWITSAINGDSSTSRKEARSVEGSRAAKRFWQTLIQNLRADNSNNAGQSWSDGNKQQAATKRRHDDTKLISLNDKHRYSLVVDNEDDSSSQADAKQPTKQQALKTFILTTLPQILSPSKSPGESGSSSADAQPQVAAAAAASSLARVSTQHSDGQQQASNQAEQRDLSQLVPHTWKEAAKRTYNNVQQSASTQWRSIEGQISGWLGKPSPASSSSSSSASSSSAAATVNPFHTPAQAPPGVLSAFVNTVGSIGMKMIGLDKQANSQKQASSSSSSLAPNSATSSTSSPQQDSSSASNKPAQQKTGLAGMASMIFNTITGTRASQPSNANNSPTSTSSSGDKTTGTSFNKPTSVAPASSSSNPPAAGQLVA